MRERGWEHGISRWIEEKECRISRGDQETII